MPDRGQSPFGLAPLSVFSRSCSSAVRLVLAIAAPAERLRYRAKARMFGVALASPRTSYRMKRVRGFWPGGLQ
jgi:hypothetical protein